MMKRFLATILLLLVAASVFAQGTAPLRVTEIDGFPDAKGTHQIKFPNGSLSNIGGVVTVTFPAAGVTSVFSRSGAVTAQANDYTFAQIGSKPTTLSGYGITDGAPASAKYLTTQSNGSLTNAVVWPGLGSHPDLPPASANAADDEFDSALSGWTNLVIDTTHAAVATSNSRLVFQGVLSDGSFHAIYKATSGGTWKYRAGPFRYTPKAFSTGAEEMFGLFLRENSTGKGRLYGPRFTTSVYGSSNFYAQDANNTGGYVGNVANLGGWSMVEPQYIEAEFDGTNIIIRVSLDGVQFLQVTSELATAHFTTAPDRVGFGIYFDPGAVVFHFTVDWFRKIS
jgi:hypothetical protein